ncbi:hypothetical protein DICPUDRAFT_150926 [Dictyostelium purpureum]|uniref:GATA-type domain-containing protein n=1 Tax=Dictyostelium purpureum TaxID=5786 RepID=F0ZHL2_DICPU|nr:uncharacterized protein DICPUDRAFT_150926 [Dictyostelium purpureum]XP_003287230.1 uncharacterized protein DICPUDRAFT_151306 [Dictyostelium purpureum]EGC36221.1 hypothetical protein DICPUDRAFT_151306 [Dictyostelium purpureum]EGC36550.1 hypothetical protein DICPUDRAFT_150926 [Dictyostelium purpureum]|eukprot:XP_003286922.1 hypothetical protein DICPUDRAFT_150926 [Dictyostelium purpureum]
MARGKYKRRATNRKVVVKEEPATNIIVVEKRKKGRPPKEKPEACHVCRVRATPEWRNGWLDLKGTSTKVPMCNACGLHNAKQRKIGIISREQHSIQKLLN